MELCQRLVDGLEDEGFTICGFPENDSIHDPTKACSHFFDPEPDDQ